MVDADENVVVKIMDEAGNIVFFDTVKGDAGGNYSAAFVVPSDMVAEIMYVSDATDGVLTFQVTKDDVDIDGYIEIVALRWMTNYLRWQL